jgi:hypothetical protein
MVTFQLYLQSEKPRVGGGMTVMLFLVKKFPGEKEVETLHCRDARKSSFVSKVRGEVFAHFHAVTVKRHSSMRN